MKKEEIISIKVKNVKFDGTDGTCLASQYNNISKTFVDEWRFVLYTLGSHGILLDISEYFEDTNACLKYKELEIELERQLDKKCDTPELKAVLFKQLNAQYAMAIEDFLYRKEKKKVVTYKRKSDYNWFNALDNETKLNLVGGLIRNHDEILREYSSKCKSSVIVQTGYYEKLAKRIKNSKPSFAPISDKMSNSLPTYNKEENRLVGTLQRVVRLLGVMYPAKEREKSDIIRRYL